MNKIKNILHKLFGIEKYQIKLKYSVEDSIYKLSQNTYTNPLGIWNKSGVIMAKKGNHIKLYWHKAFVRNSFNRNFNGQFIKDNDKSVLTGNISTHLSIKIFMAIWLGGIGLFLLSTLISVFALNKLSFISCLPFVGMGLLLLTFAYFLLEFCFKLSTKGEKEILDLLSKTLENN